MPRFRLLHASDLHFGEKEQVVGLLDQFYASGEGVAGASAVAARILAGNFQTASSHNQLAAEALAQLAVQNRDRIDAIVLSGDLATTGLQQDLAAAHYFATGADPTGSFKKAGAGTLASSGLGVHVIPGNHDRFGPPVRCLPGNPAFDALFGQSWGNPCWAKDLRVIQRGATQLVIIGVDLTLPAGDNGDAPLVGHYGRGRALDQRVDDAVQLTRKYRTQEDTVVVWVIHFKPKASEWALELLQDTSSLAKGLRSVTIDAILCGHTHVREELTFQGIKTIVCGTSTQYYAPNGNWVCVLDITVEPGQPPVFTPRWLRFDMNRRAFL